MENEEHGNLPKELENLVSRTEIVAGHEVEVYYDKEDTGFTTPKGSSEANDLSGDELQSWKKKADNEFRMKSSANQKYAEAAERLREVEKGKAELERLKEELAKMKADLQQQRENGLNGKTQINSDKPDFHKILSELSGEKIESIQDEMDFEEDNEALYRKAKSIYEQRRDDYLLSKISIGDPKDIVKSTLLRSKIEQDGNDYEKVKQYASLRGWKVDEFSYEAYKKANPTTESITEKINQYAQPADIIWITPGSRAGSQQQVKTLEEEFSGRREDLENYCESELMKENPDPRVIAFIESAS